MPDCPTPQKTAYRSEGRARKGAVFLAREAIAAGEYFPPMYIYPCACGSLHMTKLPDWYGEPHELLYEVADHLQAFAAELREVQNG